MTLIDAGPELAELEYIDWLGNTIKSWKLTFDQTGRHLDF